MLTTDGPGDPSYGSFCNCRVKHTPRSNAKMKKTGRRGFLAQGTLGAVTPLLGAASERLRADDTCVLQGELDLRGRGRDFSPVTGLERKAIPSACWQCVTRDGIIC